MENILESSSVLQIQSKLSGEMDTKEKKKPVFSEIIREETPVLVDFYADWCAPCKMMNPVLKKLKKRMGSSLNIIKIDVDKNPKAAARYNVRGVPTLILFRKGKILWQQAGSVPETQLFSVISQKLNTHLS
jgi:thioredoxin 1